MHTHQDKIFTSGGISDERILAPDIKVFTFQNRMGTNQDWTHEIFTQEIYQMTEYLHEILKFPYIIKIGHIQFSLWRNQNNHISIINF